MNNPPVVTDRRSFLRHTALTGAFMASPGVFAEALRLTPSQTEGPFYPDHLPLDTDNDLIVVNDGITPAVGEVTWLSGRIRDERGSPLRNVLVEIWQCDSNGAYIHSGSDNGGRRDRNFQGFGRFLTGSSGEYLFRTIKPVAYPGRTPHIHFALKRNGHKDLVSQLYIAGDPRNEKDGLFMGEKSSAARRALTAAFRPMKGSRAGELAAKFDIVMAR